MNNSTQIISSDTFSNIADIVYSKYVQKDFIKSIEFENYEILSERGNFYLVKIKNYNLSDNSIIYTNTEAIDFLFEDLKQVNHFKNLILITHESDVPITEKIYFSKPLSISKWFGINVIYKNDNLIPIPIGIPGQFTDFYDKSFDFQYISVDNKINKIYINFRDNTNNKERSGLKSYFEKKDWAVVSTGQIDSGEYQNNLRKYKYNLCPIGNGFDTYRIWETLAAGSIPIAKKHPALKRFEKFPIIFLENLKINNLETLEIQLTNIDKSGLDFLNIEYWKEIIMNTKEISQDNSEVKIYQNQILFDKRKKIFTRKENMRTRLKKIKYFLSRYTNIKNYLLFLKKKLK